jgi:heme/copper-type cytochrome/quinol oxidase subunit 2
MFTVSVKVEPVLPQDAGTLPPERSAAASDATLVVVVLAVVMVCLCAFVLIYRRRRRSNLGSGAFSYLKYNFVAVANLYSFKVDEMHSDDLVKIGSEN